MSEQSMKDFENEINASFQRFAEGDILKAVVVGVSEEEINMDMNSLAEGVIPTSEFSDDPNFHAMDEIKVGETLDVMVLSNDDGHGRVKLSLKRANEAVAWDQLLEDKENKSITKVKVIQSVNGGVIAYHRGIRGFIPASLLSVEYVEDLDSFIGDQLDVIVSDCIPDKKRLILSAKDVVLQKRAKEHEQKLSALQKGFITEGVVERIESYGCFVAFGDGLTGLVHISQICGKFLHSPNEVVKLGQTVKVKVLEVAEGKIKLSMKEAEDLAAEIDMASDEADVLEESVKEHVDSDEVTTSLGDLLNNLFK